MKTKKKKKSKPEKVVIAKSPVKKIARKELEKQELINLSKRNKEG